MHEFVFLVNGEKVTVNQWEDVPTVFDHVIKFLPEIPPEQSNISEVADPEEEKDKLN